MRINRFPLAGLLCLISLSLFGTETVLGKWKTDSGKSLVEITRSSNGKLEGCIVWLKEPTYTNPKDGPVGSVKVDGKNPDPALKTRPILGLRILEGFVGTSDGLWEKGTIYDPENGKTYKCRMKLVAPNRLEVRGFIGISLIGRTTVWIR